MNLKSNWRTMMKLKKNRKKILRVNQKKSLRKSLRKRKKKKKRKDLNLDLQAVTLDPDMREDQAPSINQLAPPRNLVPPHIDHLAQAQEDTKLEDLLDHLAPNIPVMSMSHTDLADLLAPRDLAALMIHTHLVDLLTLRDQAVSMIHTHLVDLLAPTNQVSNT